MFKNYIKLAVKVLLRRKFFSFVNLFGIALTSQALTILINARSREQLASLRSDDLLISPALGDVGSEDFDRMKEAMRLGEEAARNITQQLQALSLSADDYAAHRALVATRRSAPPQIDRMTVAVETRLAPEVIASRLHDQTGQVFDAGIKAVPVFTRRPAANREQPTVRTEFDAVYPLRQTGNSPLQRA